MDIYTDRIRRVRARMQENSILLIKAAPPVIRNNDTYYPYRAHSDILYLTGVNEEELSLLITQDAVYVFARVRDAERERWTGFVKGHAFYQQLFSALGDKNIFLHETKDFSKIFSDQILSKQILYFDFGIDPALDAQILGVLQNARRFARRGVQVPPTITQASTILSECRLFKDAHDLLCMREAARISSEAHNKTIEFIESWRGNTLDEFCVKALIEHEFMKLGADRLAYPSIVAGGKNATILHYENTEGTAPKGAFILIDAGCEYKGYASDITRTTVTGGKNFESALQKELYALTLKAQTEAIRQTKAGSTLDSVHDAAVDVLARGLLEMGFFKSVPLRKKDEKVDTQTLISVTSIDEIKELEYYNLFYMHRTSHYLGLDVHDVGSYYHNGKSRALENGMVITVEPGLYFPEEYDFIPAEARGIGIRIEDDVLVTQEGNEVLTQACRK
ncbi:MAG TPA: aminopeptidase P N-terminal domain-containing protein [Turneriella sp.]|nr:aminopeptidase P N-terminal domain-containing protein [Turneriella sp.]